MFKKKPIVSNDVCSYTVLAVCVWLYEGKRYSPLAIKKKRDNNLGIYNLLAFSNRKAVFTAHV